jgi:hypothetical protein
MQLSPRDRALLTFLDRTPATTAQILKVSATFDGEPFHSERRARERMQVLADRKLARSFSLAISGGGLANYYKLTPEGYRLVHGSDAQLPHRSFFLELPPSRLFHSLDLADAIVQTLTTAHARRMKVTGFHRESELVLEVGTHRTSPDCHVQFTTAGRTFNILFELDRSTEPLDSTAASSIRGKLLAYEAYQDYVLALWKRDGESYPRPAFRVAFLTTTTERLHHILALAKACAGNANRRLCYGATLDSYLGESDAVRAPLFLDHQGRWQALVNIHPSAAFLRAPVRIAPFSPSSLF